MKRNCSLLLFAVLFPVWGQPQGSKQTSSSPINRTAVIIGVTGEMRQLSTLSAAAGDRTEILLLRQEILSKVTAASLQVDATTAQIDNEVAECNELRGYLADRRDRSVNRANLWSIILGGGLGATSAGLQLPAGQKTASAVVGIAGGALSSGLAISGIRAQKGSTRVFEFNSNMLAQFFSRPALEDSRYDPIVWRFLNEVAVTDPDQLTRKDRLIHTWYSLSRIDPAGTVSARRKIDRVTSQPSERAPMTIDDLEDRAAMLEDVRAKVAFLKRDLAALLAALPNE